MKEIMVTRTVEATRAVVLCLNTETAEPFNAECIIPYGTDDKEKALKYRKRAMECRYPSSLQTRLNWNRLRNRNKAYSKE